MMAWHRQCDAKHHIDAYFMVKLKVWTYGIDGSLQSSLPMPRRSETWLKLAARAAICIAEKVAEHTGIISEATSRAGTTPCPRCHTPLCYVLAAVGMGKGAPGGAP